MCLSVTPTRLVVMAQNGAQGELTLPTCHAPPAAPPQPQQLLECRTWGGDEQERPHVVIPCSPLSVTRAPCAQRWTGLLE